MNLIHSIEKGGQASSQMYINKVWIMATKWVCYVCNLLMGTIIQLSSGCIKIFDLVCTF